MADIFTDGIERAVTKLLSEDKAEGLHSILTGHRNSPQDDASFVLEPTPFLDRFQHIFDSLPETQRRLFCIFLQQSVGIDHIQWNLSDDEKHPFLKIFMNTVNLDVDAAQDFLIDLYNGNKQKSFAVALNYYAVKHRYPFIKELAENEKFNRHLVIIESPQAISRDRYVTPLVVVISNGDVASYHERTERAGEVWMPGNPEDHFNDGFEVISSNGVFRSLVDVTKYTLNSRASSRLYGAYGGEPSAALHYESLIKLHAEVLKVIKDSSNFFANAVSRAQYQKEGCAKTYHGGMFGQRFLKQTGYPDWAEAVWNEHMKNHSSEEIVETAYNLTRYGLFRTLTMAYVHVGGRFSKSEDNDEYKKRQAAFLSGFVRALQEIKDDLIELSGFDSRPSIALDKYIAAHGFHKDLDVLGIEDKKKAAYADMADYFTGAFSFQPVMGAFLKDEEVQGFNLKSQIPYTEAFDNFISTGNYTAAFRLLSFTGYFAKEDSAVLNRKARAMGITFFDVQGLRIAHTSAPRDGYSVPLCFHGNDVYAMPPFTRDVFVNVKDLTISDYKTFADPLNIDYSILALERASKYAVGESSVAAIQTVIQSIKDRAKAAIQEFETKVTAAAEDGSFYEWAMKQHVQGKQGDDAVVGFVKEGLRELSPRRPAMWRAMQMLGRVSSFVAAGFKWREP